MMMRGYTFLRYDENNDDNNDDARPHLPQVRAQPGGRRQPGPRSSHTVTRVSRDCHVARASRPPHRLHLRLAAPLRDGTQALLGGGPLQ